jgi:hypothetical protein
MSALSEQDDLHPNYRLYDAPRWLRERSEPDDHGSSVCAILRSTKFALSLQRQRDDDLKRALETLLPSFRRSLRYPQSPSLLSASSPKRLSTILRNGNNTLRRPRHPNHAFDCPDAERTTMPNLTLALWSLR